METFFFTSLTYIKKVLRIYFSVNFSPIAKPFLKKEAVQAISTFRIMN